MGVDADQVQFVAGNALNLPGLCLVLWIFFS